MSLDKSKYPTKKSIGEDVRKSAGSYFDAAKKGKNTPDTRVKKVFKRKVVTKGGEK